MQKKLLLMIRNYYWNLNLLKEASRARFWKLIWYYGQLVQHLRYFGCNLLMPCMLFL